MTESAPNPKKTFKSLLAVFLIGLTATFILLGLLFYKGEVKAPGTELRVATAKIKDVEFRLEVADTPAARAKGLGGRQGINPGEGMLFVFDTPDIECFWMKDVSFSIDILWFDADKKLIYAVPELSPSTYPDNVCPPLPSQYVIELPAGTAKALGFNNGDVLLVENL